MNCSLCIEKKKDWWDGNSEIRCAFSSWVFNPDNWNCWTMDSVREEAEKDYLYRDDMYYSVVGDFLVSWYKSRWTTDDFYNINTRENSTLKEALELINKLWKIES